MKLKKIFSILLAAGLLSAVPLHVLAHGDRDDRHDARPANFDRDDDHGRHHGHGKADRTARDAAYEAKLIAHFAALTGSTANATSLVRGVHNDTTVEMTRTVTVVVPGSDPCPRPDPRNPVPPPAGCGQAEHTETQTETVSFDPPTPAMKYMDVAIALAFMELGFREQNVDTPTLEAIKDALAGDKGILTMRAKRMSWEKIAHVLGFKLHQAEHHVQRH